MKIHRLHLNPFRLNKTHGILLFLAFVVLLVSGCEIINPEEPVPAYVEIRTIGTQANYPTQGTSSGKVTDVWVYTDGAYLGTYPLPARIPILKSGKQKISLGAGILLNGIASTREAYSLYKFYETEVELSPGNITSIDSFTVSYFPGLQYTWFEDFERDTSGGGISLDTTAGSLGNILPDSVDVFEGQRSLKMEANANQTVIECASVGDGFILDKGKDIYLELNYKCNQPFVMGLTAITFTGNRTIPIIRFNTKPDWNKIYVRLSPYVNANGDALKFKVYFKMELPSGSSSGLVFIDNIKLISN